MSSVSGVTGGASLSVLHSTVSSCLDRSAATAAAANQPFERYRFVIRVSTSVVLVLVLGRATHRLARTVQFKHAISIMGSSCLLLCDVASDANCVAEEAVVQNVLHKQVRR